uniref:CSON007135 protein n=1 Tax=Culicoides sonorensis TaxID=179676 RepID=A0A336MXV5_CULSO
MSRKHNNVTSAILYSEKKTRRGRPYSPYCSSSSKLSSSKKLSSSSTSSSILPMLNNNISLNECEIEQSQLLAQIIEDARNSKRNNNTASNNNSKKVPSLVHQNLTTYRDVASHQQTQQDSETELTENQQLDQYEPTTTTIEISLNNHQNANNTQQKDEELSDDDPDDGNDEAPLQKITSDITETTEDTTISTTNGGETTAETDRSDSVIFTGSYTQHDLDLEEISRIRTNVNLRDNDKVNLKDFDILKVLGTGAYGKVFLVRKNNGADAGQLYAMKVIKKAAIIQKKKTAEHTRTERQVMKRSVRHQNNRRFFFKWKNIPK